MLTQFTPSLRTLTVVCTLALASSSALAQNTTPAPATSYQQQKQYCQSLQGDSRASCEREAGAALEAARKHQLAPSNTNFEQNRLQRCMALPDTLRADCEAQMENKYDTEVYGSVAGGGVLRQTTITIPGEIYYPEPTVNTPSIADPVVTVPNRQ